MRHSRELAGFLICIGIVLVIVGIWLIFGVGNHYGNVSLSCPRPNTSLLLELAPNRTIYYFYRMIIGTYKSPCYCYRNGRYNLTCLRQYLEEMTKRIVSSYGYYPTCARATSTVAGYVQCIKDSTNITIIIIR